MSVKSERKLYERIEKQRKETTVYTYLMYDGNFYKIGKSKNPEIRLNQIKTGNPNCDLLCYSNKITEVELHTLFYNSNIGREWFDFKEKPEELKEVIDLINNGRKRHRNKKRSELRVVNIKHGNIKIKQLRGQYHASTQEKVMISYRKKKSDKRKEDKKKREEVEVNTYKNFIIPFGKYKNSRLIDMVSIEQINYLVWFIHENEKEGEGSGITYRAFKWKVLNNNTT